MANQAFVQKRDYPRYEDNSLKVIVTSFDQDKIKGKTLNISQNGICAKLDKNINVEDKMNLALTLPFDKINVDGKVVWKNENNMYGISFVEKTIPTYWKNYIFFGKGYVDKRSIDGKTKKTKKSN